ncbi:MULTISPECIES: hypothetical protein [Kitasatospora]|uniref:Uncharacterized protein n=1 Tax=Kitasatospora cystarginea TaxID=58350 RepID=A0ABP5QNK4_9ACTN
MTDPFTPDPSATAAAEVPAQAVPVDPLYADDDVDVRFEVPIWFHSLGLEMSEEQRAAHHAEIASEIWAGGTDYQRTTVAAWYAEIAEGALEDGVLYAGINYFRTDDDRLATANLVIQAEKIDTSDAGIAAASLVEMLSADPDQEVFRTDVHCGPAVVVVHGQVCEFGQEAGAPATLELAQAEVYIPVQGADTLLVMRISTPSLPEFPTYVTMLAQIADSVYFGRPSDAPGATPAVPSAAASRITEAFG